LNIEPKIKDQDPNFIEKKEKIIHF